MIQHRNIISFFIIFFTLNSIAQKKDTTISDYYIDFAVPDLGAFTLLNTKPDNITTPGNTKELAASLLNIVGSGANITPGLAIDWAPAKTFIDKKSPQAYKKNHLLQNLQLNLGTVQDSSGSNVGIGFRWVFWDKTDPLLDTSYARILISDHHDQFIEKVVLQSKYSLEVSSFLKRVDTTRNLTKKNAIFLDTLLKRKYLNLKDPETQTKDLITNYLDIITRLNFLIKKHSTYKNKLTDTLQISDPEKQEIMVICKNIKDFDIYQERYQKAKSDGFEKHKKVWLKNNWNRSVWLFGAGWVGVSADNKWRTLGNKYFKAYVNCKLRCGDRSQFVLIGTYTAPDVKTQTDSSILRRAFVGGRFLTGNAANRFSIDLGYGHSFAKKEAFNLNEVVATIGFEFKLDDGIFFEIAGGFTGPSSKEVKDALSNSKILALGSLKYAFNKKKRFDNGTDDK